MNELQVANNHCFKGGRREYLFLGNKYTCFTFTQKRNPLLSPQGYSKRKEGRELGGAGGLDKEEDVQAHQAVHTAIRC